MTSRKATEKTLDMMPVFSILRELRPFPHQWTGRREGFFQFVFANLVVCFYVQRLVQGSFFQVQAHRFFVLHWFPPDFSPLTPLAIWIL
jgi:hypothetical protein